MVTTDRMGWATLQSTRAGAVRIGLDGAPASVVAEADEDAREKLAALGTRRNVPVEQKPQLKLANLTAAR